MRTVTVCADCGSRDIDYLGNGICHCNACKKKTPRKDKTIESPFERTRRSVYASGNRWAIENFNATHY